MKVRTGDTVVVISGKDRGKTGKVIRSEPKRQRIYIEGVNIIKRHQRPIPGATGANAQGGVIEREGSVHISNVMLVDPESGKPTRVGITREDGVRKRIARKSNKQLD